MPMPDYEFAWACGLFEGEGSFSGGPGTSRTTTQLSLGMIDRDVVERFQRAVGGIGAIRIDHCQSKPFYIWQASAWPEIKPLIERMLPMLGDRRLNRALSTLANPPKWINNAHAYGVCRRGHILAEVGVYESEGHARCKKCTRDKQRRLRLKKVRG